MKNNVQIMKDYIERKKDKSFTTYEIQEITNTTCPHSVVADLKKLFKVKEEWKQSCKKIDDGKGNIVRVYKNYKLFKVVDNDNE